MLSVIIPSRNEHLYLEPTIKSVLDNAHGEIEILVVLDGWLPEPELEFNDDRVVFIHNKEPIGQRPAINQAARVAKGDYIMKLDSHCAVAPGFDVVLARDCEYDTTMIPRMYNLDVVSWQPKHLDNYDTAVRNGKVTDYMYIGRVKNQLRTQYYSGTKRKELHLSRRDIMIDETMSCMGPCYFMHKKRFLELGGEDENHGHWGQQGIEKACKAWLSGGRLLVNKNTWFAHYFRGGGVPEGHQKGFPYPISGGQVNKARKYSEDLWLNNKWERQVRSFKWLINKFNPPGWEDMTDLTILFYTANVLSKKIMGPVTRSIRKFGYPIVSVTQEPMDLGVNIVVPKERSLQNIYRQVLTAAKTATTEYVALCEDDCLYNEEHFKFRPSKSFGYNRNRWLLHLREGLYSFRDRPVLSQCIAKREDLIKHLEERENLPAPVPDKYCGEPGVFDARIGVTEYELEMFETPEPNLIICHRKNITGRKFLGEDKPTKTNIPKWGDVNYWLKKFRDRSYTSNIMTPRKQHSHIASTILSLDYMHDNRMMFCYPGKEKRLEWFMKCFPIYLDHVIENYETGKKDTNEELRAFEYYDYLMSTRHPSSRGSERSHRRCLWLMRDLASLYADIKENGLRNPIDLWIEDNRYILYRGGRRLEILKVLGYDRVPCRVFKTKEYFRRLNPSVVIKEDKSINTLAMKQFQEHKALATDKYWVHRYTPLYDAHVGNMRNKAQKVLEMGVFRGASLLLWKDAFPNATIYGVDIKPRNDMMISPDDPRIKVFTGRQEDEKFMRKHVLSNGPFDIIVDDAGHKPLEMRKAFKLAWDSVSNGGWYVVEDLFGNYRRGRIQHTIMEHLKDMIDDMNLNCNIGAMHFYYNICFIQKSIG